MYVTVPIIVRPYLRLINCSYHLSFVTVANIDDRRPRTITNFIVLLFILGHVLGFISYSYHSTEAIGIGLII